MRPLTSDLDPAPAVRPRAVAAEPRRPSAAENVVPLRRTDAAPVVRPAPAAVWRLSIGDVLRTRRIELGLRLADVAERARVSTQYLSEIERGRKEVSSEVLQAVSRGLELDLSDVAREVADRLARIESASPVIGRGNAGLAQPSVRPAGPVLLAA